MDDNGKLKLWAQFEKDRSPELREKIILEYAPLVKLVAGRLAMYLGYNVEYDDLCGYGNFGLIDAIDKFDFKKEVKFETYASLRIRGSILDQIRKMDWIPRTVRQRQRKITDAIKDIESRTGRSATDDEIAQAIGISNEEYDDWQSQMKVTGVISLDEFVESGSDISDGGSIAAKVEKPEEAIEREELKQMLAEALQSLTEKEQKVVLLYYYEELTLKEISNILEVSESRVSQLHTKALNKMKVKLGPYVNMVLQPN